MVSELAAQSAKLKRERAERETITAELALERGKTLVLSGQVDDLKAQVRHLADLSQKQQLDIEWMTGLARDGVPPPSILRRRRQRDG